MINMKNFLKYMIGIIVLFFFLRWVNLLENLYYLRRAGLNELLMVLALMWLSTTLRGVRFYRIGRATGLRSVKLGKSILANYVGSMFALVSPGRLGESGKVFF